MFPKIERREISEMPIAPILDMMVAVIFFLLLSTTFVVFTKHSLPPSVTKLVPDLAPSKQPLNPHFFAWRKQNEIKLLLQWSGQSPGQLLKTLHHPMPGTEYSLDLVSNTSEMVNEFVKSYPNETTIQLSFGRNIVTQEVISVMDGVRKWASNIVLLSYDEVNNLDTGSL